MEAHVVMFSGGKDSTAMLHKMLELGMPVDKVIFGDLGSEWPQMYDHIQKVEEHTGISIDRCVHPKGDFYYWFYKHLHTKGKGKGVSKGYGWCGKCRWGTAQKRQISAQSVRALKSAGYNVIEYHGIALDEMKRTKNNRDGRTIKYPLIDFGMTEADALEYCYSLGYDWGGLYEQLDRVSCWCCENKNLKELRYMFLYHKDLWDKLEWLQTKTVIPFKGRGVAYYTQRFSEEGV